MNQQSSSSSPSFIQIYALMQWLIKFPALTLMVMTRRDIGYRLLNPLILIAVFGLLAVVTILSIPGNESANQAPLLVFALIGFLSGIAQRIRRWRDVGRGVNHHTYYIGSSPLDFHWLPSFIRRNRRVARYIDPIVCAGIGLTLFPYSPALAAWLVFAAFCLRGFEDQVFQRERNRDLDLADSIHISEEQSRVLEQYEQARNAPQHQNSPGIPTGLGDDIQKKIHSQKHSNPSMN